jgi:integrase
MARKSEAWTLLRDPRTGVYTVRFTVGGRRAHKSTRTTDRATALERARAIYEAALNRRPQPAIIPLAGAPVMKLCSAWLEAMEREKRAATIELWSMYVSAHFGKFFRDGSELVDPRRLSAYVSKRLAEVSASTVRKECSALSTLLAWCARPDVGYLESAPTVPRPPKGAEGARAKTMVRVDLTSEQVEALLERLPERVRSGQPCRAFFRVLWETGLRRGTLYRLRAPDDYRRGAAELVVRAEADKAGYARAVPLTAGARAALDSVVPKSGALFPECDYRYQLEQAARAIGIAEHLCSHVSHHDFRHARTTALVDSGAPLTGVAYLVGHKRISTTDGYAHARQRAAVAALAAMDTGHRDGHRARSEARKAKAPKRSPGAVSPVVAGACGREDLNLHGISPTRSLGECGALETRLFRVIPASGDVSKSTDRHDSGHGVRLAKAALAMLSARGTEHFEARALDLAELIAEQADGLGGTVEGGGVQRRSG